MPSGRGGFEDRGGDPANAATKARVVAWARAQVVGRLALGALFGIRGRRILIPMALTPFSAGWLAIFCAVPQHAG